MVAVFYCRRRRRFWLLSLDVNAGTARSRELGGDVGVREKLEKSTLYSRECRGKTKPGFWGLAWSQSFMATLSEAFLPFLLLMARWDIKDPIAVLETWKGLLDLDASKWRGVGTVGLLGERTVSLNPHSLLGWHVGLGAEWWDVEKSTFRVNKLSAQPIEMGTPVGTGSCHPIHSSSLSQGPVPGSLYKCLLNEWGRWLINWLCRVEMPD